MQNPLSAEIRQAVIENILQLTREKYVFPEVGLEVAQRIQSKYESGAYDAIVDGNDLATMLTSDLREYSNDLHWNVVFDPDDSIPIIDPEKERDREKVEQWLELSRHQNFGFEKVERLKGNVGLIDLRRFAPSEFAGETAVAAMSFVAHCEALIFDLRKNHGGYPSMVQLITSYLVDPEPIHINTFYYRPTDDYQQFWTFPHVPGNRMVDTPVYVLTSSATGSGAEEFVYNLKNMGRASIVGERTMGAAHPVTSEIIQEHFKVKLPYGRPINPITEENWEGTGVEPHVEVPQDEALKIAHVHALEGLIERCGDFQKREGLVWNLEIVRTEYTPVELELSVLTAYEGEFGKRTFAVEDGALTYKHQDHPTAWALTPITETSFRLDEDMKFEFILEDHGGTTAVVISYMDGRPQVKAAKSD